VQQPAAQLKSADNKPVIKVQQPAAQFQYFTLLPMAIVGSRRTGIILRFTFFPY